MSGAVYIVSSKVKVSVSPGVDDFLVGVYRSRLVPWGTTMVTTLALIAVGWGPACPAIGVITLLAFIAVGWGPACPAIGVMAFWLMITVEGFPVPLVHWGE